MNQEENKATQEQEDSRNEYGMPITNIAIFKQLLDGHIKGEDMKDCPILVLSKKEDIGDILEKSITGFISETKDIALKFKRIRLENMTKKSLVNALPKIKTDGEYGILLFDGITNSGLSDVYDIIWGVMDRYHEFGSYNTSGLTIASWYIVLCGISPKGHPELVEDFLCDKTYSRSMPIDIE